MKDEPDRRDFLKGLGALGAAGGLAGCNILSGPGAPEIDQRTQQLEDSLQSQISWSSYPLNYEPRQLEVGKQRLQPTGVEDAHTYRIEVSFPLADNSDDLEGWMATRERMEEFFSLLNQTTYDVLTATVDNFDDFHPGNQPSAFNQVNEYKLHVDAEKCSYVEDIIPSAQTDDILSSRSAYNEYIEGGEDYNINIDGGFLDTGYLCEL